jgi:hypothetical protein
MMMSNRFAPLSHALQRKVATVSPVILVRRHSTRPETVAPVNGSSISHADTPTVPSQSIDLAVNLQDLRPGDTLEIPYELTVTDSFADLWHSAFFSNDRLQTSTPFSRKLGFQDRLLPFGFLAFLTSGMSHAEASKIQVGFGRIEYYWPGFAGDTFTKRFQVQSVRNTSDQKHSIISFQCDLINQRGRLCMRADKRMLFETQLVPSVKTERKEEEHLLRNHILSKATLLEKEPSQSLVHLEPGLLIQHSHARCLTSSQMQQLASLARLTHPRHYTGSSDELYVPGGLILGQVQSASARELHEILHESVNGIYFNQYVHPDITVVGAMSYVQSVSELPGNLELVQLRTLGIDMQGKALPDEVPTSMLQGPPMMPKDLEKYCDEYVPELSRRIVAQMDRQIIRQAKTQNQVFLL